MVACAELLGYRAGLLPQQIEDLTVAELFRVWEGFAWRRRDDMNAMAMQTLWIRTMLDAKTSREVIRESFGWTKKPELGW